MSFAGQISLVLTRIGTEFKSVRTALTGKAATVHTHVESDVTSLVADLSNKQPLDSDLTAIAALSTTSFGRAFLPLADAAASRTYIGAEVAGAAAAAQAASQPVDSDLTAIAALTTTSFGRAYLTLADATASRAYISAETAGAAAAAQAASQPLDADLTAIAALASQTTFGRALLTTVDAAGLRSTAGAAASSHSHAQSDITSLVTDLSNKQPLDTDLTAIAALTTTSFGRAFLSIADAAAGRAYIGAAATAHAHAAADVTSGEFSADARFPAGFKHTGQYSAISDANAATSIGDYYMSAGTNGPGLGDYFMRVSNYSSGYVVQDALDFRSYLRYTRQKSADVSGGAWSAWQLYVLGNDSRLTDARTPVAHNHVKANITDFAHGHPVSDITSLQGFLDAKAPLASPAFTGTPTGITKAHVGLGSVDNTADTAKPVSTAQSAAIIASQADYAYRQNVKTSCVVGTTANITLSGFFAIDGYTPVAGERILVKNQTTVSQNGIYVTAAGAWALATDAVDIAGPGPNGHKGMSVFVEANTQAGRWQQNVLTPTSWEKLPELQLAATMALLRTVGTNQAVTGGDVENPIRFSGTAPYNFGITVTDVSSTWTYITIPTTGIYRVDAFLYFDTIGATYTTRSLRLQKSTDSGGTWPVVAAAESTPFGYWAAAVTCLEQYTANTRLRVCITMGGASGSSISGSSILNSFTPGKFNIQRIS